MTAVKQQPLLRALAETLAGEAATALADNGTSLKKIDINELVSQFKSLLEASVA